MNKKPIVKYNHRGQSGNIYVILVNVKNALRKQSRIQDYNNCWERVNNCHSYEEALNIIKEYVELVKEDK